MKTETEIPSLKDAARQFVRLVGLIRPYWTRLIQGMALALVFGLVGMISPYLTKLLIDEVYPSEDVTLMHVLVAGMLALTLSTTLLASLRGYFSLYVNTRLNNATRLLFFNHLQHLEARFFEEHQVGEINSRFQDVGKALESIGKVFQTVFVQGVYLVLVPPVLLLLEWRLALVALVSIPLTFVITVVSGRILRRFWKRSSEAFADLNAFQIETLSHIRTFKTMGLEHRVYRRGHELIDAAMGHQLRAGGLGQLFGAANGVLRSLNMALFTWFGWTLILGRQMTLGDFMAFSTYIGFLYNPIHQFIQLFSDFQQSAIHLSRMFEYLDAPVEQEPVLAYTPPGPITHRLRGEFRFEDVTFGYDPERPVLREIDLTFPIGSVTAIVGPSGSGKTSLLRLVTALEHAGTGRVTVDDTPIERVPLPDLRRQIAVVWQEVSLLKGSLWENLTLGCEAEPARSEVDEVMSLCGLDDVLAGLPEGYETTIAEWGSSLSAGQRQRVALARALLRGAPILVLDEATANIDVEREMEILRGVFADLHETTVLFVTHRMASAALADQICVLEDGRVTGFGKHRELLESCSTYQRLYGAASGGGTETRFRRSVRG